MSGNLIPLNNLNNILRTPLQQTLPPVKLPENSLFTKRDIFVPYPIVDIKKDIDLSTFFEKHKTEIKSDNETVLDIKDIENLGKKIKTILDKKGYLKREYENLFKGNNTPIIPQHSYSLSDFTSDVLDSLTNEKHINHSCNIKIANLVWDNAQSFDNLNNSVIDMLDNIIAYTNVDNEDIALKLCSDKDIFIPKNLRMIGTVLKTTNRQNHILAETICKNPEFLFSADNTAIESLFGLPQNENEVQFAKKLWDNAPKFNLEYLALDDNELSGFSIIKTNFINSFVRAAAQLNDFNIDAEKLMEEIHEYKEKVIKNPALYLNDDAIPILHGFSFAGFVENQHVHFDLYAPEEQERLRSIINGFFMKNGDVLPVLFELFDKETIDNLFRRRFIKAQDYLNILGQFNFKELQTLKKMLSCKDISGKPFLPSQKIELMDMIVSFRTNAIPISVITESIVDNKIDLEKLKANLFKGILQRCGLAPKELDKISNENITKWNLDYMHLLPNSIDEYPIHFPMIIRAACRDDFMQYIHDETNEFGKANQETKKIFKNTGMDYEAWIHPDKNLETTFVTKDKNMELLSQTAASLIEDIEELRNSPAKGFFDKQFAKYIEKDAFKIPQEIMTSRANLSELINNIKEQLRPVWERAEKNKNNPLKQEFANKTLTILSHLKIMHENLDNMKNTQNEKKFNLTIKMIDRVPQKDLFQGNYSTCCIRVGEPNSVAMCDYLMNTTFNMIELVDNDTGKTIGNALCYFVQDEKGVPMFVVDNIEINNSCKPSSKVGLELRNKIFEYARNIARSVTGKNTEIVMSKRYNDVPFDDLIVKYKKVQLLGKTESYRAYMDLFDGWTTAKDFQTVDCYYSSSNSNEDSPSIIKKFVNWLKK